MKIKKIETYISTYSYPCLLSPITPTFGFHLFLPTPCIKTLVLDFLLSPFSSVKHPKGSHRTYSTYHDFRYMKRRMSLSKHLLLSFLFLQCMACTHLPLTKPIFFYFLFYKNLFMKFLAHRLIQYSYPIGCIQRKRESIDYLAKDLCSGPLHIHRNGDIASFKKNKIYIRGIFLLFFFPRMGLRLTENPERD